MSRWMSFALLLGIIVAVAFLFYRVMAGFFLPMFLAVILVIMFRPLHLWCLQRWPKRERFAAVFTTTAVILVVVIPTVLLTTLAAVEASSLVTRYRDQNWAARVLQVRQKFNLEYPHAAEIRYLEASLETLREDSKHGATAHGEPDAYHRMVTAIQDLETALSPEERQAESWMLLPDHFLRLAEISRDRLGSLAYQRQLDETIAQLRAFKLDLLGGERRAWMKELANPTPDELSALTGRFFAGAPGFLRAVGDATTGFLGAVLMQGAVMVLSMYFFLTDGPAMLETLMRLSPLNDAHERELVEEFDRISRAVVLATLLSAVAQGVLAGMGFWFAGVGSVFLLSMITIVFAMVPFVGAAAVWLPACFWLYLYEGRPWAAMILAAYGILVVSMADNLIKPLVLHGQSNLHPLLALLSVVGGVQALGPLGILVGPMIVVFLQTLLNILHRELIALEDPEQQPSGS